MLAYIQTFCIYPHNARFQIPGKLAYGANEFDYVELLEAEKGGFHLG